MLQCGVSEKDITPALGAGIPGYFEWRYATGVLDPLFAKALVLEQDGTVNILIVCDTITVLRQDVLRIRKGIADLIPVCESKISVSATHTHTGGPIEGIFDDKRDYDYVTYLVNQSIAAAIEAYENRRPAKIGFATGTLPGYSFIRRHSLPDGTVLTNPGARYPDCVAAEGEPDFTVTVAKITDTAGKPIAFLSSYGVHPDMIGGNEFSADYMGELSRCVKAAYGHEVVSVYFTGPCGNTNHINCANPESTGEGIYQRTGHALFEKVRELAETITCTDSPKLCMETRRFGIGLTRPDEAELSWAKGVMAGDYSQNGQVGYEIEGEYQMKLFARLAVAASENKNEVIEVEVMVLHMDDACIVLWPTEIFVDFGQALRREFPGRHILIGELSNGTVSGYIPTQEAAAHGGYEPRIASRTHPARDAGDRILAHTISMLK